MKKLQIFILLACLSCSSSLFAEVPATAKIVKAYFQQNRKVSNFNGIATGGSLNVKVTMGSSESLRLEGDADAIAELITEVKDGILEIRPRTKWNDWNRQFRNAKITVHITAKKLSNLTLSGSGNISVSGTINSGDLTATISGSGIIRTNAHVNNFRATISGSGRVFQSGKAQNAVMTLSGSGSFNGKDFSTDNTSVQISGSGSATVTTNKALDAVVSGSGSVHYYGDAAVKKKVSGSGSIRKG